MKNFIIKTAKVAGIGYLALNVLVGIQLDRIDHMLEKECMERSGESWRGLRSTHLSTFRQYYNLESYIAGILLYNGFNARKTTEEILEEMYS